MYAETNNLGWETSDAQPAEPVGESSVGLVIVIILLVIAAIVGGVYIYLKIKTKNMLERYSMHPEDGIPKQDLTFMQQQGFRSWKFNEFPKNEKFSQKTCDKCTVQLQESLMGQQFCASFRQNPGIPSGIISNNSVGKCNSQNVYFEVEIEDLPAQSEIYVGFCQLEEFIPSQGITQDNTSQTSVVINSSGQVYVRSKMKYEYQFKCQFGQTLGIGMRLTDGRVWFSYNGKFLNEPSRQEIMLSTKDEKLKQKLKEEEEQSSKTPEELQAIERNAQLQIVKMDTKKIKEMHPVITSVGPSRININIGSMPFRLYQKEIAKGLVQ